VLSRGFDRCLIVYTQEEWGKVAERLDSTPLTRINARRVARFTFSGAYDLDLDRQGRVNLPATLREYAAIGDEAVVIGAYSHLQIWDKSLWDAEKQFMIEHATEISEAVET
jgi:MraZ protein